MHIAPLVKGTIWPYISAQTIPFKPGEIVAAVIQGKTIDSLLLLVKDMVLSLPLEQQETVTVSEGDRFYLEFVNQEKGQLSFRYVGTSRPGTTSQATREPIMDLARNFGLDPSPKVQDVIRSLIFSKLPLTAKLIKAILAVLPDSVDREVYLSRLEKALVVAKSGFPVELEAVQTLEPQGKVRDLTDMLESLPKEVQQNLKIEPEGERVAERIEEYVNRLPEQELLRSEPKLGSKVVDSIVKLARFFARETVLSSALSEIRESKGGLFSLPILHHGCWLPAELRVEADSKQGSRESSEELAVVLDLTLQTLQLGSVHVRMRFINQTVSCTMFVATHETKSLFDDHLESLRARLVEVGLQVGSMQTNLDSEARPLIEDFSAKIRDVQVASIDIRL